MAEYSFGLQEIFAWILIVLGLVGGLVAPFLVRMRTKHIAAHAVGWVWWFLFAVIASQFVAVFITMAVGKTVSARVEFTAALQVITYFIMFAMMILLPWRQWKNQKTLPSKSKKSPAAKADTRQFILKLSGLNRKPTLGDVKKFLTFFPLYFVTNMAASIILLMLMGAEIMGQDQNIGFAKTGQDPLSLVLIFFCLIILAPLFEEMLVRGALFGKLREKLKFWPAALLTAGVFALIHGQFNVGVMTFILALYAAYLREKTGAIWSGIMLHAMQNLIAFCLLFLVS